jgi:hypothetical protein
MSLLRRGLTPLLCLSLLSIGTPSRPTVATQATPLAAALATERLRPAAPMLGRDAFLARSNLVDVALSPQGSALAYLRRAGEGSSLWLLPTAGGPARLLVRHSEATRLHWSADGAWLFLESSRQLFALALHEQSGAGVMTLFGGRQGRHALRADPAAPAAMLVTEEVRAPGALRPSAWRLLQLVPGTRPRMLFESSREILAYVPGNGGGPAFVKLAAPDHYVIATIEASGGTREVMRCVRLEHCAPLSSPAPGELLLSGDVGGNFERLLRLDARGALHLVHEDPAHQSDIDETTLDPATGRPLIASYRSAGAASYPLTAEIRPHMEAIGRALGGADFRLATANGRSAHWLVTELGDQLQQPRRHLYDPASRRLSPILADIEDRARRVPETAAARRSPFTYRASDGFLLHGFLAVPPGADPARIPLVVQVHGGPWSHASAGYSSLTQFLVNRGYAVFEPNFRGSTGYGRAYAFAGGSDFGNGRVQQDVIDGTRYVLGMGVGDPSRVGITGISFGGYSALLGVTFSPDLFRVAVAAMPPADFGWVMRWQLAREPKAPAGPGLAASLAALAVNPADPRTATRLTAQSPLVNAALMRRPLLLIAGGRDASVPLRSVVDYAARLRTLGRDVSLLVDPQSGHHMEAPETQAQYLYGLERMLSVHLGGRTVAPPAQDITTKLSRNLRLAGYAFSRACSGNSSVSLCRPRRAG